MENYITAERIANSIMQEKIFKGTHILVEGSKDLKVYTKFFNREETRLTQSAGKYKLRDAYYILEKRGFTNAFAIRDADFLRIRDNPKFNEDFQDNIFVTDGHDSEMMMIMFDTLEDLLSVSIDQHKIKSLEERIKSPIKKLILDLAYTIGCLRLANKKYNLGLSFKPENSDGNRIKFKKFIDENSFSLDVNKMINTITEYSKNRGQVVSSRETILEKIQSILPEQHCHEDVINGHDVAEIICIVSTKGLKSRSSIFLQPDSVEESLALSFDRNKFRRTKLYEKILQWQTNEGDKNLFSEL